MYEEIFNSADLINQYLDLKGTSKSTDFFSSIKFSTQVIAFFLNEIMYEIIINILEVELLFQLRRDSR